MEHVDWHVRRRIYCFEAPQDTVGMVKRRMGRGRNQKEKVLLLVRPFGLSGVPASPRIHDRRLNPVASDFRSWPWRVSS